MPEALPADLAASLDATRARRGRFGEPLTYVGEATSTNDLAAALATAGAPEGATVLAGAQTAGRGRLGRTWFSPPGSGVYMSIVLRARAAAPYVTLAAGVAVVDGIGAATGLPLELKWPNDVVTRTAHGPAPRRKIAGILAEASSSADGVDHVVLGIGINLTPAAYPREIAGRASCVETELGRPVEAGPIVSEVLAALAAGWPALAAGDPSALLRRWIALAPSASGTVVECEARGGRVHGITAGIDASGALLVRLGDGVERIVAGEVVWK
jgi:BirA family transcriptional regulator, biotin operon repressor / biotin---[acetyl-CoA-carboxylase] ligase